MAKSKLTLIVDGNWLLMSRLPIVNARYVDDATLMTDCKALMIKSINIVLKTFPMIDNVIFVSDGGSWRKDIPVPDFIIDKRKGETAVYKGNRERTDVINWDLVFHEFNSFVDELVRAGISAFHEPGIEGDDWCWYWSQKLNAEGTNVIIWTKDRDITQLCSSNDDGCFTIVWNKQNGVFLKKDEDLTKFLLNPYYQQNESILNAIIDRSVDKIFVNPEDIQIDKIIRGDAGDNILPIMTRSSKTGERVYRPSAKQLPESMDIYSTADFNNWLSCILQTKQWQGKARESLSEIYEHFVYNRQMVVLDKKEYPDEVLNKFSKYDDWFDKHPLCTNIEKAESVLIAQQNNVQSTLNSI